MMSNVYRSPEIIDTKNISSYLLVNEIYFTENLYELLLFVFCAQIFFVFTWHWLLWIDT